MGRRRRRNAASGTQVIQVQQMFQNLLIGLDSVAVQRILESREVLAALADGRLTPKKALASLGLPVMLGGKAAKMDFFGVRDASDDEVREAFRRQGMRPATEAETRAFMSAHPETARDIVVRSRKTLVAMGDRVRVPSRRQSDVYWGYPVFCRTKDGLIEREVECTDTLWDVSYRFLGVRVDRRPKAAAFPTVSLSHVSPKVRPQA